MTVSARLRRDLQARLTRFCGQRGISKTQAIERGLELLLEHDRPGAHPAYLAYRKLDLLPERAQRPSARSSDPMRAAIRAKYPD